MTIAKKMSWAAKRRTTRKEDVAYCLLGIFNVNMPLIYGEGSNAFLRLQKEIMKQSNDLTLFAWQEPFEQEIRRSSPPTSYRGILAVDPIEFSQAANLVSRYDAIINPDFSMTNKGLRINIALRRANEECLFMPLGCSKVSDPASSLGIYLRHQGGSQYLRMHPQILPVECSGAVMAKKDIFLSERTEPVNEEIHGNAFVFEYDFGDCPIKFLSAHPQELWDADNRMFITSRTPDFIGYLRFSCAAYGLRSNKAVLTNQEFLVACALSDQQKPWVSLGQANGPLATKPIDGRNYNLYDAAEKGYLLTLVRNGLDSIERLTSIRIASIKSRKSQFVYKYEGFELRLKGEQAWSRNVPMHRIRISAYGLPRSLSWKFVVFSVAMIVVVAVSTIALAIGSSIREEGHST